MAITYSINIRPETWPNRPSSQRLKPEFGGEPLRHVTYGTFTDEHGETHDLEMLMRISIYEQLLSGEYEVIKECSERLYRLIVVDKNGRTVKPVGSTIY